MQWICALFALALIALVATADAGLAEPMFEIVHRVPLGDKIGHVFLLGTMSLLLNLAIRVARFHWGSFHPLQGTAILVLATLEEISQLASTHRTFSFGDAAGNAVGIVTFGWLAVLLHYPRTR